MEAHYPRITAHGGMDLPHGFSLLTNPLLNKGTAFSERERDALGLRGLLPPRVFSIQEQATRSMRNFRRKPSDLERYIFLTTLQHRNETLFYRILLDHLDEMMPVIYTPTVGQACLEYGTIFRRPRGLWITNEDTGRIAEILRHWPHHGVRLIVVTDGERILGLGDLGALGMGIPIGKLALYTACAGVHPSYCLPITLDVGTDNEALLHDDMYIGLRQRRLRGEAYDRFIEEFVSAVQNAFPGAVLQFEDFGNHNAFMLLERYRRRVCCFNDDIQGTASVALAGLMAATRITGQALATQRVLFFGAGEAATGIGELFVSALVSDGVPEREARSRCWFFDSKGLVVSGRGDLPKHKAVFAKDAASITDFEEAVRMIRPTAIVGAAGVAATFSESVVRQMAAINERPIVFALSNPTSKAECTAEQAYTWSDGRAIFAGGSPFAPVTIGDRTFVPGQGNNVYVFPGIGLGVLVSQARIVTQGMFLAAARALAQQVTENDLNQGRVFPPLTEIREVSAKIAAAVMNTAFEEGLAGLPAKPADLIGELKATMFVPDYDTYL